MQNSRHCVKISPRIEQHKLHNTFNKNIYIYIFFFSVNHEQIFSTCVYIYDNSLYYYSHVLNIIYIQREREREYNGLGQVKDFGTTSNSTEA